jgi:hypothetical protein
MAVVALGLMLTGCGMLSCGESADNRTQAGSCGAHTTFFAVR